VPWPELTAALNHFRATRAQTLQLAATLSPEPAARRVRPNSWSGAEVLDHLIKTEVAYRKYLLQTLERARAGATGTIRLGYRDIDTRLRPFPLSWMPLLTPVLLAMHALAPFSLRIWVMRKPGRIWAAAPKVAQPRPARPLAELRHDLETEIQHTTALFEADLPAVLPQVRAAHPLYGSNNTAQMFLLMAAHEERHQHQLRAILKAL
jgi:uncharacterized damage-inducible protein DinB